MYLRDGRWPQYTLFDLVQAALPLSFFRWLFQPESWFGLHKFITLIFFDTHITIIFLLLSFIAMWCGNKLDESNRGWNRFHRTIQPERDK